MYLVAILNWYSRYVISWELDQTLELPFVLSTVQRALGRALDNIFTERVWRTVKYEEVYIHDYLSPREARQALTRYFTFYDQECLHQVLDYQTPVEVYFHQA